VKKITKDGREICTGKDWTHRREECAIRAILGCESCHRYLPLHRGEAHHIIKRGMGGGFRDDRLENLMWLCMTCHREEELSGNRTKMQGPF
jgi:HNH endonuclease